MRADLPIRDELVRLDFEVDASLTLAELGEGPRDPTVRFEQNVVWRALRTPAGLATTRIARSAHGWRLTAWGPGADLALAAVPRLLGVEDDPAALVLRPGRLRELVKRFAGLRFGRTDAVWPALLVAVCGQKVTAAQAHRAYYGVLRRWGERAPGPRHLLVPPAPEVIAALPYYELHSLGLEQRRALTLIHAAQELSARGPTGSAEADLARLQTIPGIGPWTMAEVARRATGDPDAVSVGDFHIPNIVCWALAGEPRGDDARMLELLAPYHGQRARVVRLLEAGGIRAPRFGPRLEPQRIERL